MSLPKDWQGLPYYPISQFYREKFGEKVYKISVSTAETCPNREGLRGMKTCNFCDVWGSAAYPEIRERALSEQIIDTRDRMMNLYNAKLFLVYFQAYTNTFGKSAKLKAQFDEAFQFSDVVGAVVGTRPDCISDAVLDFWAQTLSSQKFLSVELGVQTFDEEALIWMRRGHTAGKSLWAIEKIKQKCPEIDLGIHLMFGLPGETDDHLIETARLINGLPIDNVKLHNLHVLKGTPLEEDFNSGAFQPIERTEYFRRSALFLQHLSPKIAVHRLAALSTRPEELIAPIWTGQKMRTYQGMLDYMADLGLFQGQLFDLQNKKGLAMQSPLNQINLKY